MKIKKLISFILSNISNDDLLCTKCNFLFKDNLSTYCGVFDDNIKDLQRCKKCIDVIESIESNVLLRTKYR